MKILLIGGNGNISWHCTNEAVQSGYEVWILNRGVTKNNRKKLPYGVNEINADIRDIEEVNRILKHKKFDIVVDFICFTEPQALADIKLFSNVKQFFFISTTAVYQRKNIKYPISENASCENLSWDYALNKYMCEKAFLKAYYETKFPVTIIRPGHTYDTILPTPIGGNDWTIAKRLLEEKPIVMHGDGTTLWTMTHSQDFARALVMLFGREEIIGESFHITSDEWLTWRQIIEIVANNLGVKSLNYNFATTEDICRLDKNICNSLLGHKMWCDIYDNSRIKKVAIGWNAQISFNEGIKESISWHNEQDSHRRVNVELERLWDQICRK